MCMKRILLLLTLFVAVWCTLAAKPITKEQALREAQQFMKGKTFVAPKTMKKARKAGVSTTDDTAFYVFNAENNGGFVIVSGDDRTERILGYADQGQIDFNDMPENLKAWLDGYAEQIGALKDGDVVQTMPRKTRAEVAPLITTQWNQRTPYNLQCPSYHGELSVTGCVATAMAQLMYYHKCPQTATPVIPAYTTESLGLSLDALPATSFQWSKMKDTYTNEETGEAAQAVAELMRYCGQAVKMNYTPTGSGAYDDDALYAYMNYFGFSNSAQLLDRTYYSNAEWEDIIYQEISAHRPVFYLGTNHSAGHAFICDGYDSDGLFHINWGWGGRSDGNFVLSVLNPYDKGIGGGTSEDGYTCGQGAIVALSPTTVEETIPGVAVLKGFYPYKGSSFSRASSEADFSFNFEASLSSNIDCTLDCGLALYKDGTFVSLLAQFPNCNLTTGSSKWYEEQVQFGSGLEDGDYELLVVYSQPGANTWLTCYDPDKLSKLVTITGNTLKFTSGVQQNVIINHVTLDSGNDYKLGTPQTITLNITNQGYTHEQSFYVWLAGQRVGRKSSYLDHGETNNLSIVFVPTMTGSVTLKVSTDNDCQDVIYSEGLTITSDTELADGDMFVYPTVEGIDMLFKVISSADKTCQVGAGQWSAIDTSTEGVVTVPGTANGYKVVSIADYVFGDCTKLTKVIFDASIADARPVTTKCWFYNCSSLQEIEGLEHINTSDVTDMRWMFYGCSALQTVDVSHFDTGNVTAMKSMFCNCNNLSTLDVSHFDTSNVTDMSYMFYECESLTTLDVSGFNTSKVANMHSLFDGCEKLLSLDVSGFNTSNVTDMSDMFFYCRNLNSLDVSGFNTSNVTDMSDMFYGCKNLTTLDISNFDTRQATKMQYLIYNCDNLESLILPLQMTSVPSGTFINCSSLIHVTSLIDNPSTVVMADDAFDEDVYSLAFLHVPTGTKAQYNEADGWKKFMRMVEKDEKIPYAEFDSTTGTLTFAAAEYIGNKNVYLDFDDLEWLGEWDAETGIFSNAANIVKVVFDESFEDIRPESTSAWFYGCSNLQNISSIGNLNTSLVTDMSWMFYGCSSLQSVGVSNFNTSNVTAMNHMFHGCSALQSLNLHINTSNVTNMAYMFADCTALQSLNLQYINTSKVTNMSYMFAGCSALQSLDLRNVTTYNVVNMTCMFSGCSNLTTLDLSRFNTSKVVGMGGMFQNCEGLQSLDLSNFDTKNVEQMWYMFLNCSSLTTLNVSSFDTSKVLDMDAMFYNCYSLEALDVSNFNTGNVENMRQMFTGCSSLTSLEVSNFNTEKVTDMYAMFAVTGLTSLDLSSFDTKQVTDMSYMTFYSDLTSLVLPSTMTSIQSKAFVSTDLTSVSSSIEDPSTVTMATDAFDENVYNNATLYVPRGTESLYRAEDGWNLFLNMDQMVEKKHITSAGYATFYSPYALDFSAVEGLKAYIAIEEKNGTVKFQEVTSIPPYTGVMLKGAEGDYEIPVIKSDEADDLPGMNFFRGVLVPTYIDNYNNYVLMGNGEYGVGFYQFHNRFRLSAKTAYIHIMMYIGFIPINDDATGVECVAEGSQSVIENCFDLSGRKIASEQMLNGKLRKGMYIINGKKVFIK